MNAAVFLDRDGTIIIDRHYPADADEVQLLPGAADALRALQRAGLRLVVVSNQSGVGRGIVTEPDALAVHRRVVEILDGEGVHLDGAYYCFHAPEAGCECRKPAPGMLRQAAAELGIDLAASFMIGDKEDDVDAGRRAGCRTISLTPEPVGEGVARDLAGAAELVLGSLAS